MTTTSQTEKESSSTFDLVKEISKSLPDPKDRNVFWDIVCSIFEPGVNPGLMIAIHFSFISLFLVHLWLLYLTKGQMIHIWFLVLINVLLYPSLLVFIKLVYKTDPLDSKNKTE